MVLNVHYGTVIFDNKSLLYGEAWYSQKINYQIIRMPGINIWNQIFFSFLFILKVSDEKLPIHFTVTHTVHETLTPSSWTWHSCKIMFIKPMTISLKYVVTLSFCSCWVVWTEASHVYKQIKYNLWSKLNNTLNS